MNVSATVIRLVRDLMAQVPWLRQVFPWLVGPWVGTVSPVEGWPGSILEITGAGFSSVRDDNVVQVGGDQALVLEASASRLLVLAGRATASGPIGVTVAGTTVTGPTPFTVLPYPAVDDLAADGPPVFIDGPVHGTPRTGVQNQRVLVAFAAPTDHPPGPGGAALRTDLMNRFGQAATYWQQATYNATTWQFEFTDWFNLHHDRRFYFWEQGDVDDARRALTEQTSAAIAVAGQAVLFGTGTGLVPVDYPIPGTIGFHPGVNLTAKATAIRVAGNRAYALAGAAGLHVIDVTNPLNPAQLGSAAAAGWGSGVDVTGNTAVVAAREGGLLVFNVANPAAPTQVAALPTDGWASAVRLRGTTALVGAGAKLLPVDVANPAAPVAGAGLNVNAWVNAVDASGGTCVVATDGDGLHVFDVTGPVPVEKGTWQGMLRLRDVTLSGNTAFVAGNDGGLIAVDVTNLAAPAPLGTLATSKPAFAVAARGGTVFVATGNLKLSSVDAGNPAALTVHRTDDLLSGPDPDLTGLRNQLQQAGDSQNLIKDGATFMLDALPSAQAVLPPGEVLNDFQGFIVIVNGGFLRGQSWTAGGFHAPGVGDLTFNETKGVIYIATDASWGRIAHEIGHWLGMWDIYTDWHSDGTYTPGTAAPWCLSGDHDLEPLWCAHQIHEKMAVYGTTPPNVNVVDLQWSPTAPAIDHTYEVIAHDANEDPDPNPDRVHLLKLRVADGLWYFVEVRQAPAGLVFDQHLPLPAGAPAAVLVTRVFDGTSISNTRERPIEVFEVLTAGQQAVDAARDLIIRHDGVVQDRPHIAKVRLLWNQPVPGDPNGQFDLSITPWDTSTWETVDVWVDSPRNNSGGTVVYENHEPGQPGKPILNGDRPWVHHANKIYARIRNTGPAAVPDVYVTCYVTSPPGIGDNGDWATLATQHLTNFPAHDPAVPGSGEQVISFDWIPDVDKHTCLKIAILPQFGEISTTNNLAQENVAAFDSAGSSPHQPVILEAEARSPFIVRRKVDLDVRGLPDGWHAVVDHAWVWLEGKATKPVTAVIWTDYGTGIGKEKHTPPRALPRMEGWTWFDHRYLPIGGILADVKATTKVDTTPRISSDGKTLIVRGCLIPPVTGVPITIEVTDDRGHTTLYHTVTDSQGCYDLTDQKPVLPAGKYTVQVFVTAGGDAAETQAKPMIVSIS